VAKPISKSDKLTQNLLNVFLDVGILPHDT